MITATLLAFPALLLAAHVTAELGQLPAMSECWTSTFPVVTMTHILPTMGLEAPTDNCDGSLVFTTALPTIGQNGVGVHTYTITQKCDGDCKPPHPTLCPPGFTITETLCHVCGPTPVTTTLTLPCETTSEVLSTPPPEDCPEATTTRFSTILVPGATTFAHPSAKPTGEGQQNAEGSESSTAEGGLDVTSNGNSSSASSHPVSGGNVSPSTPVVEGYASNLGHGMQGMWSIVVLLSTYIMYMA